MESRRSLPLRKPIILLVLLSILSGIGVAWLSYTGPGNRQTCRPGYTSVNLIGYKVNKLSGRCHEYVVQSWACDDPTRPWELGGWADITNWDACEEENWPYSEWLDQSSIPGAAGAPATIAAVLICDQPGLNGWCRSVGSSLQLTGNEPMAGQHIVAIEGTRNGENFACASATCNVPLAEGANSFQYWAKSSFGDTSLMGTSSLGLDTVSPQISASVHGTSGSNG